MRIITDTAELADVCARCAGAPFVTIDTEFLRETTFWPKLCLIQIASPSEAAIIDPLADPALDLGPLLDLLQDERITKVFHAARQDIEIFYHLSGKVPHPIFDTQVAAMVCGFGDSIAYDQLVLRISGARIDKSLRFTDWASRPLTEAQLAYALADVTHLREVYTYLQAALLEQSRTDWVQEEMAVLTSPATYETRPEEAWRRLKLRVKSPLEFAILQAVSQARETEAQERDVPRSRVLKDDAIYELAAQKPASAEAMARLRALPKGFERSRTGKTVLAAVQTILERPKETLPALPPRRHAAEGSTAAVELLKVLLRQVAEQHGVAAKVVATTEDLDAIASDDEADVAALHGWRYEVFGEQALRLKRGEIGLSFDGRRVCIVEHDAPVRVPPKRRRKRRSGRASDQADLSQPDEASEGTPEATVAGGSDSISESGSAPDDTQSTSTVLE